MQFFVSSFFDLGVSNFTPPPKKNDLLYFKHKRSILETVGD